MNDQDRTRELTRQVEDLLKQIDAKRTRIPPVAADELNADLANAERAMEHVLEALPNDPRAMVVGAKVLKRKAEIDSANREKWMTKAVEALSQVIQIDPGYDRAYYNRACYLALAGQKEAAFKDLRQAVELFALPTSSSHV